MAVVRSLHGCCTIVARLLYDCCTAGCTIVTRLLYDRSTAVVRLLCYYCTKFQHDSCIRLHKVVRLLYNCCYKVICWLFWFYYAQCVLFNTFARLFCDCSIDDCAIYSLHFAINHRISLVTGKNCESCYVGWSHSKMELPLNLWWASSPSGPPDIGIIIITDRSSWLSGWSAWFVEFLHNP